MVNFANSLDPNIKLSPDRHCSLRNHDLWCVYRTLKLVNKNKRIFNSGQMEIKILSAIMQLSFLLYANQLFLGLSIGHSIQDTIHYDL